MGTVSTSRSILASIPAKPVPSATPPSANNRRKLQRLLSLQTGPSDRPTVEKLQSLRGMVDLLPEQIGLWQQIETMARRQFAQAAIREIRTPLLEATELFARGIGEATDVVGKEM